MSDETIRNLDDHRQVYRCLRRSMQRGNSIRVIAEAGQIAEKATDRLVIVQAIAFQLGAMINTGDLTGFATVSDRAFDMLQDVDEPTVAAEVHTCSSEFAASQLAMERCLRHLELARRALLSADRWIGTADAWYDLALAHSKLGLHEKAQAALARANTVYCELGHYEDISGAEIRVRNALAVDHRGDTATAIDLLSKVIAEYRQLSARGIEPVWSFERAYIAYAAARMAAMGHPEHVDVIHIMDDAGMDVPERAARAGIQVCMAAADGDAEHALSLVDNSTDAALAFGAAEPHRLACLAHSLSGNLQAAVEAQRAASTALMGESDRLLGLLTESIAAQLDQDRLRQLAARHATAANTDALTGLPNRRHLEQYVAAFTTARKEAAVGVVDINEFKEINDQHGHLAGDLVLQRVAAIISSVVRRDDFVARYGGDEFVIVLPETDLPAAEQLSHRLRQELSNDDWSGLVVGKAPDAAIGWSLLDTDGLAKAFRSADRAMYRMKRRLAANNGVRAKA